MALQAVPVTITAASSVTFTFNKPSGKYQKGGGIPTVTAGGDADVASWFSADVDNLDGTMTGTLNFSGVITATAVVSIYDTTS